MLDQIARDLEVRQEWHFLLVGWKSGDSRNVTLVFNATTPGGRPALWRVRLAKVKACCLVSATSERELPPVAALRHRMRNVRIHDSSYPRHRPSLSADPSVRGIPGRVRQPEVSNMDV
jgi:hypothetical protein